MCINKKERWGFAVSSLGKVELCGGCGKGKVCQVSGRVKMCCKFALFPPISNIYLQDTSLFSFRQSGAMQVSGSFGGNTLACCTSQPKTGVHRPISERRAASVSGSVVTSPGDKITETCLVTHNRGTTEALQPDLSNMLVIAVIKHNYTSLFSHLTTITQ